MDFSKEYKRFIKNYNQNNQSLNEVFRLFFVVGVFDLDWDLDYFNLKIVRFAMLLLALGESQQTDSELLMVRTVSASSSIMPSKKPTAEELVQQELGIKCVDKASIISPSALTVMIVSVVLVFGT